MQKVFVMTKSLMFKLPAVITGICALCCILIAMLAGFKFNQSYTHINKTNLIRANEHNAFAVKSFLTDTQKRLEFLSTNSVFTLKKTSPSAAEEIEFDNKVKQLLSNFASIYGYDNAYYIDVSGNLIRDAKGVAAMEGLGDSQLVHVYKRVLSLGNETVLFSSFEKTLSDDNSLTAFAVANIKRGDDIIGAIAVRISSKQLASLMSYYNDRDYIYGLSLNNKQYMEYESSTKAYALHMLDPNVNIFDPSVDVVKSEHDEEFYIASDNLAFEELNMFIYAKLSTDLAQKTMHSILCYIGLLAFAALLLAYYLGYLYAQKIILPIKELLENFNLIAEKHHDVVIGYTEHECEIGDLARGIEKVRRHLVATCAECDDLNEKSHNLASIPVIAAGSNSQIKTEIIAKFEAESNKIIQDFNSKSGELEGMIDSLSRSINNLSQKSGVVDGISSQASNSLNGVVNNADDMMKLVDGVLIKINETNVAMEKAVDKSRDADKETQLLTTASREIGNVVQMIQNIAEQINLLAINATIESARAGEAGKGFAVVASEVKNLAQQTTDATKDIADQVENIQNISSKVVSVLKAITDSIKSVNDSSNGMASTINKQGVVTNQISMDTKNANQNISSIHENVNDLSQVINTSSSSAKQLVQTAKSMISDVQSFSVEVKRFLQGIKD